MALPRLSALRVSAMAHPIAWIVRVRSAATISRLLARLRAVDRPGVAPESLATHAAGDWVVLRVATHRSSTVTGALGAVNRNGGPRYGSGPQPSRAAA